MTKNEMLKAMSEKRNGYLLTSDAAELNISRTYFSKFVKENNYECIAKGVYLSSDAWSDELYALILQNKGLVYCDETALFLNGLTEREPCFISVAAKRGYNAKHLRAKGIKVRQYTETKYLLGISYIKNNFGNELPVYNRERSLCDLIYRKNDMDIQTFQYALKTYMKSKEKNIHLLLKYAAELGIEEEVRKYTEVLL